MKMSLSIHRYIYLLFFALIFQSIYPGFAAGTLVRTPLGYKNIENLNIGDFIYSYDTRGNTYVDIIKHISTHQNARSFGVMVEDYFVTVSPDQVKVDYIKSGQTNNGQSIFLYIVKWKK